MDDLKSDSNKSRVVCNAGERGLRGGRVSGEGERVVVVLAEAADHAATANSHQGGLQTRRTQAFAGRAL